MGITIFRPSQRLVIPSPGVQVWTPGVAFVPTNIAGLGLWLKADSLVLSDGDTVTTWTDSSGNARNGTGVNGPVYKANIVNTKPVVRFDGANDYVSGSSPFTAATDFTYFIVHQHSDANSTGRAIFTIRPNSLNQNGWIHHIYRTNITNGLRITSSSDGNTANIQNLTPASSYPSATWRITSWICGSTLDFYLNGTLQSSTARTAQPVFTSGAVYRIGNYYDEISYMLSGDVAEILLYDSALGTSNRQSVETYLNTKYAIY